MNDLDSSQPIVFPGFEDQAVQFRQAFAQIQLFTVEEMPVVVIATKNSSYEKVISNIQEVKARKGQVIAIVTEGDTEVKKMADLYIKMINLYLI